MTTEQQVLVTAVCVLFVLCLGLAATAWALRAALRTEATEKKRWYDAWVDERKRGDSLYDDWYAADDAKLAAEAALMAAARRASTAEKALRAEQTQTWMAL